MECVKCGTLLEDDARFCQTCGTRVSEENIKKKICVYCGKRYLEKDGFCIKCGAPLVLLDIYREKNA